MKKQEFQKFKNKPLAELQKECVDCREKLRKLKFDLAQGKVKNIKEVSKTRKTIAKIMTLINQDLK